MKKFIELLAVLGLLAATSYGQINVHGDKNFTGDVNLDGNWKVKSTKITATGTEINQLDGNIFTDVTVDSISCLGDLDITASNLVVKLRAAESTDLGRFSVRSLEAVADRSNSDYVEWVLLEAYDSQTNLQVFARLKIISSDITHGSEDCNIELWYDVAGTPTLGAVWDSGGLTVKGLKNEGLTASKPVFTDAASKLTSAGILGADQGGTGTNTITAHGLMLGAGTAKITVLAEATDGQLPIGDSGAVPVLATITGTADEIDVSNGAGSITIGLVDPLTVAKGGSGVATLLEHGVMVGSGTGVVSVTAVGTDGQLFIGASTADPGWQTMSGEGTLDATGALYVDLDAHGLDLTELPELETGEMFVGDTSDSNANVVVLSGVTVDAAGLCAVDAAVLTAGTILSAVDASAITNLGIWAEPTFVTDAITAGSLFSTSTVTIKDLDGNTMTGNTLVHIWSDQTATAMTFPDGVEVDVVTAEEDYWVAITNVGTVQVIIQDASITTNIVNTSVGPRVVDATITLLP